MLANLPGQRLTDENIILPHKVLQASFHKMIFREHLEEVGVGLHAGGVNRLFPIIDGRLPQKRDVRRRLHFRNIHLQFFLVPIGQAQELVISQHEGAFPLRGLMRHLVVLHHVGADQDHERQTDGQPHRLHGGV